MKKIIACGFLMGALLAPNTASAEYMSVDDDETTEPVTYGGIAFKYSWIKPNTPWENIITRNHPGIDVFLGGYLNECWALELGYDCTTRKPKAFDDLTSLNISRANSAGGSGSTKWRIKNFHVDLAYFIPGMPPMVEPFVTVGVLFSKSKVHIILRNESTTITDPYTSNTLRMGGKTKVFPRFGLGVQSMVTDFVGVRAVWRWENTAKIRMRFGAAELPEFRKIFHNGQSFSVGVFLRM